MLRQICSCYIIREINILLARRVNQNNALRAPTHISNALMSTSLVNLIDRPSRTKSSLVENENVTSDKSDVGDVFGNLRKGFCEPSRRKEIKTKSAAALKVKSSRRNSHSSK